MKKRNLLVLPILGLLVACTTGNSSTSPNPSTTLADSTSNPASSSQAPISSKPVPVSSTPAPISSTSAPISSTSVPISSSQLPISSSSPVVVKPTISITNTESSIWIDDTLQITHEFSDSKTYDVTYSVSDSEIATISTSGLLTGVKKGNVDITVTSMEDETISATYSLTINNTFINTSYGFGNWNYDHMKDENPYMTTTTVNAEWPYCETMFNDIVSQKYYVEAKFNVTSYNGGDVWNRISIGHRNTYEENYVYRGLQVSIGNGSQKKIVMMETPNNWGDTTDRSQVWNLNNISNLDFTNLTLGTLRNGNNYYYFINDELYWMESIDTRFAGIDTVPAIVVAGMHATVSDFVTITDSVEVDKILVAEKTNRILYPTFRENVVISNNADKIEFKNNNDQYPFSNIKDNCAKSIGDAFSIRGEQSAKIDFDFKYDAFGADNNAALLGVTFQRYSNGCSTAKTLGVSKFVAGYTPWDYNGDMPSSLKVEKELDNAIAVGEVHHLTITRMIVEEGQRFSIALDGKDLGILEGDDYKGALFMHIGCINANATVTNLTLTNI